MRRETLTAIVGVAVLALGANGYIAAGITDQVPGFLTTIEMPSPADPPELPADSNQSLATLSILEGEPVLSSDTAQLWASVVQSAKEGQWRTQGNVIDTRSGEVLLDTSASQARTPASTTKVLATLAVLKTLDSANTLTTSVRVSGSKLSLGSEGDFLLGTGMSDPDDVNGHVGLTNLAGKAIAALVNTGITNMALNWANPPFDGPDRLEAWTAQDVQGYVGAVGAITINAGRAAPSVCTFADGPESTVTAVFAQRLQGQGIAVTLGRASSGLEGTETIATIQSAPLGEQIRWVLYDSDDILAEQLGCLSVKARDIETSLPGAVSMIHQTLEESGVPTSGLSLGDCSGLSSDDRITPQTLVGAISVSLASTGPLADLPRSLPWAEFSGTIERRMTGGGAYANAQVKMGTLEAVSSLAGIVQTSISRIPMYAIGSEDVPDNGGALTRPVLDAFVAGLADLWATRTTRGFPPGKAPVLPRASKGLLYNEPMPMRIGFRRIARALNTLNPAGPITNSAIAAGIVTRLRRAARWSEPYVKSLNGLPETAKTTASLALVLGRHSLALQTARTLDVITPIYELRESRGRTTTIRALSRRTTGLWNPHVKARVLIAPNILAAAHAHSLDRSDWCKWVALRVGLEGLIVHRAPNLADPTPKNTDFLARLFLADALLDALMLHLTPTDLSSVLQARSFDLRPSIYTLVSTLLLDSSTPQTELFRAYEDHRGISQEIVNSNFLSPTLDALSRNEDPFPDFARKGPEAATPPIPTSPRV